MPTAAEIKPKVIDAFTHKVTLSYDAIEALVDAGNDDMFADLGMGGQPIDSMAISLTQIAKAYAGGVPVLISSVRKCNTVTDCIKLTTRRANGTKSP